MAITSRRESEAKAAQQRMLVELLPFYMPKLSAVGVGYLANDTFAERLERPIERSERAKLIGATGNVDGTRSVESSLEPKLRRCVGERSFVRRISNE